ncbi:WRKY transcription factor 22-like [Panicum miliaceum]|uniref:WRKY transcription factor 22-like n=1 Tax=Panicum miliaceum TaxID=4540 RepID=A0A3L6PDU3_PANMI|nr:WRKY transcription factor 22-like [Panicum miliaceum]
MEGDQRWCFGSSSNNWDLHAVVRFACGGGGRVTPPPASDESFFSLLPPPPLPPPHKDEQMDAAAWQPLPADPSPPSKISASRPSSPRRSLTRRSQRRQETKRRPSSRRPNHELQFPATTAAAPTRSKRKKKKSHVSKEVTRVPAGAPSPDPWAWRKYGQKPIKGSPYPRGYYRCSTDKDCKARKQVEQCRTDHTTLIVSYTGEHSHPVPLHRNSLAGTTRNKPQPPASTSPGEEPPHPEVAPPASSADPDTKTKQQGSPSASAGLSPTTPLLCPPAGVEHEEEDEEEAVAASLLLEDAEMEGGDDVLLFLKPAPGPDNGSGCKEDTMLLPEPNETDLGPGNGGGCWDWEDDVKLSATTSLSRTSMNIAEEKFLVTCTGLSPWEAAASSWA